MGALPVPVYVPRRRNRAVNQIPASPGPGIVRYQYLKCIGAGSRGGQVPFTEAAFALLRAGRGIFRASDPTINSVYCGSLRQGYTLGRSAICVHRRS